MGNDGTGAEELAEVTEIVQPPETAGPTVEEQLKALQAELDREKSERERYEKGYKGLQTNLNKSNEELKKQADIRAEIDGLKETQKILAAMLQETKAVSEENLDTLPKEKRQDYLKQFEEAEKRIALKRQQEELVNQARTFQHRTEALGLKPDDDRYVEVQELVETGRFKTAEARLRKLEQEKEKVPETTQPETPKETEEQIRKRIEMEVLKKHGLLKTDTGSPSGGNETEMKIRQDYISGRISSEQRDTKLKAMGVNPSV